MSATIRTASVEDADQLALLVSQLGYPATGYQMKNRLNPILSNADYQVFVSQNGQSINGMIGVTKNHSFALNDPFGTIIVLVVDAKSRNQGVGKALIKKAESWFQSLSIKAHVIVSAKENTDAHSFYEKLGYTCKGLRFVKSQYDQPQKQIITP